MVLSYVKRRRVPRGTLRNDRITLRNVPPYHHKDLPNNQFDKENDTSSEITPQPKIINLVGFGAIFVFILLLTITICVMICFYKKNKSKQIASGESKNNLIDHARSIDRDDYDDDEYIDESELFNDKYGCVVVDTTSTVKKDTMKDNIIKIKKSFESIKSICSNNNNNNNNSPASIYNNLTIPPPVITFSSTDNYKQKNVVRPSNSFSNLKFATTTTTTITTINTDDNENWFKKPIDSSIIPNNPSRTSLRTLSISNWSKAPWQDDDNMTDSATSSVCSFDDYSSEVPKKKEKTFSGFSRFSLFRDFKRNEVVNL